jgi:hypothetical protein
MEQGRIEFDDPTFRPARVRVTTMGQEVIVPAGPAPQDFPATEAKKLGQAPRKCAACAEKDAIIHDLKATMAWMAEGGKELMEYVRALLKEPLSDADRNLPGNERFRD